MHIPVGFGKTYDIGDWSYGLVESFIKAGATAVMGATLLSAKDPKDYAIFGWSFYVLIGQMFMMNGVVLGIMPYLSKNALPAKRMVERIYRSPHTTQIERITDGESDSKETIVEDNK